MNDLPTPLDLDGPGVDGHGRGGMRRRLIGPEDRSFLIARLGDSTESQDSYTRVNCGGYGRVRRFEKFLIHLRSKSDGHHEAKPHYRGLPPVVPYRTQVFQLGGCNWACWYCFVDDALLEGDSSRGRFMTAAEMVDLYLAEPDPPGVLDLSGGQPDLVPEWCLWVMQELEARGLRGRVHVWIDDNLSGHFMRTILTPAEIRYMAEYPLHSRAGCFKGFSRDSFHLNTKANPSGYDRQFEVIRNLIEDGFDMYAYATFTAEPTDQLPVQMRDFVDRLQEVDPMLPLRTIPLEVRPYSSLTERVGNDGAPWMEFQYEAAAAWEHELVSRYTESELAAAYEDVPLANGAGRPGSGG